MYLSYFGRAMRISMVSRDRFGEGIGLSSLAKAMRIFMIFGETSEDSRETSESTSKRILGKQVRVLGKQMRIMGRQMKILGRPM